MKLYSKTCARFVLLAVFLYVSFLPSYAQSDDALVYDDVARVHQDPGSIKTFNTQGSVNGDAVAVSPQMYDALKDYAVHRPDIRIDLYLSEYGFSFAEIHQFVLDFYGKVPAFMQNEGGKGASSGAETTSTDEDCECGVLYPRVTRDRSAAYIHTIVVPYIYNLVNPYISYNYTWGLNGPAKLNYDVFEIRTHKKTSRTRELENAYAKLEFLNLCTGATKGVLVPPGGPCACDKLVDFMGHYTIRGQLDGELKGWPFSRGIWANLEDVFSVFSNDVVLAGMQSEATNFHHFETGGLRRNFEESTWYRDGLLASVVSIAGNIVIAATTGNFDQNSLNQLVSDIQSFVPNHTSSGSKGEFTKFMEWDEFFILKANVPKEVWMSSTTKISAGGYGPSYAAFAGVQSDLDYAFLINETKKSDWNDGNFQGEDEACCSEGIAGWFYSDNFTEHRDVNGDVKPVLIDFLNQYSNNWTIAPGATTFSGEVHDLYYPESIIKSTGFCQDYEPCEDFMIEGPFGPELIVPMIEFDPVNPAGIYCLGDPFDVVITNYSEAADDLGLNVEIFLNLSSYDNGVDRFTVTEPGVYTIRFGDEGDPCAQEYSFYIPECTGIDTNSTYTDSLYVEEIDSSGSPDRIAGSQGNYLNGDRGFEFYPNPVSEELNIVDQNFNNRREALLYVIATVEGKAVLSGSLDNRITQVDCTELSLGIYSLLLYQGDSLQKAVKFIRSK